MLFRSGHITLFDEVEFGLEPHRITRLIKHVREDKLGQYFLTTHSPSVLRELTVKELYVVHSKGGVVQIISAANEGLTQLELQGKIRSSTEAFLAKKVVVCEGATEVGFLRGFDDHQVGTIEGFGRLVTLGAQLREDQLGIGQRFGATKADEAHFGGWKGCSCSRFTHTRIVPAKTTGM